MKVWKNMFHFKGVIFRFRICVPRSSNLFISLVRRCKGGWTNRTIFKVRQNQMRLPLHLWIVNTKLPKTNHWNLNITLAGKENNISKLQFFWKFQVDFSEGVPDPLPRNFLGVPSDGTPSFSTSRLCSDPLFSSNSTNASHIHRIGSLPKTQTSNITSWYLHESIKSNAWNNTPIHLHDHHHSSGK